MPTFAYTGRSANTDTVTGVIEAVNRAEATLRLKHRGIFLLSVEPVDGSGGGLLGRRMPRVSRDEVATFTRQLATLLKAGIPLVTALRTLQQQAGHSPLAGVLDRLGAETAESASLSEAMAKYPKLFPRTYTAAIHAGEQGGMLQEVLTRLAAALKVEAEVRGRIRGAMIYPIFLCVVGALALGVLLTFVIPRFTKLFTTMGEQLPLTTRMLLGFSDYMDRYWLIVCAAFATLVFACSRALRQEEIRGVCDRWMLSLPWIGRISRQSEIARFCRTLSELLSSGVPILNCLQITQSVMRNRCFIKDLELLRTGVSKGQQVATVMKTLPHFSVLLVNMTAVGEQSGRLPEMLLEVADMYEKECERSIHAFTTILGPGLIVILGGLIAFVITAILLPVFQASTMVG